MRRLWRRLRGGEYVGRLAFDPDSGFHLSDAGHRVLTEDGGKTWRYARPGDASHLDRYHEHFVGVDSTANAADPEPHHYGVLAEDPHVEGLRVDPDPVAEKVTSHTEAWK